MDQAVFIDLGYDMGYVIVAFLAIYLSGWLIYDKVATRGYSLGYSLFEDRNIAAGFEICGFLMVEMLIAINAMSGDQVTQMAESGEMVVHYWRDLEAVAVTIVFSNIVFFVFRYLASVIIKWLYRGKVDNQGDPVVFNNEIFKQHNIGASLFSLSYLIIMYFMIFQEDFLGTRGYQVESLINMTVVFLTGLLVYFFHNIFFMGKGHTTLDELFMDNNSGVGMSLVGFMFAVLFLQSKLMLQFTQEEHFFKTDTETYLYLGLVFIFILALRRIFIAFLDLFTKRRFKTDFLVEDNPVAGLLDMVFVCSTGLLLATII